jgi:hypothetical protein
MDPVTQSNSSSAEESASAAEELDAQAASLKDMVGQLRQLVGGAATTSAATPVPNPSPAPVRPARVTVSSSPPAARPAARPHLTKTLTDGHRKAIPMPGDTSPETGGDDEHFKNF